MSNTIPSFSVFTNGTKARAKEVNQNFDNFRGHIVPVAPNTNTAVNLTYNLGSTNYRWAEGYFNSVYLGETTSAYRLEINTSGSTLELMKGSFTLAAINSFGITSRVTNSGSIVVNLSTTSTVVPDSTITMLVPTVPNNETFMYCLEAEAAGSLSTGSYGRLFVRTAVGTNLKCVVVPIGAFYTGQILGIEQGAYTSTGQLQRHLYWEYRSGGGVFAINSLYLKAYRV